MKFTGRNVMSSDTYKCISDDDVGYCIKPMPVWQSCVIDDTTEYILTTGCRQHKMK